MPAPGVMLAPMPSLFVIRIFLPFATGYYLSWTFRTINAVMAPELASDIGIDAAGLGLLTSVYLLTFAAFQLPLGVLLDRYGPKLTQVVLLMFAVAGALIFATAESASGLILGRALIGFGVSSCLIGQGLVALPGGWHGCESAVRCHASANNPPPPLLLGR